MTNRILHQLFPVSLIVVLIPTLSLTSAAQPITAEQTLDYLNTSFEGKCSFRDKKKYLLISFYKGGEVYREDKVYLQDMDPETVEYSPEEKAVIMRCRESKRECIDRKLIELKKLDQYSRVSLLVNSTDEKSNKGVKDALIHLIKLAIYDDHVRTEPFE